MQGGPIDYGCYLQLARVRIRTSYLFAMGLLASQPRRVSIHAAALYKRIISQIEKREVPCVEQARIHPVAIRGF